MTAGPREVWVDASAGVAGDMLLAALLDAGADLDRVGAAIDAVIPGSVRVTVREVTRAGLRAAKVDIAVTAEDPPHRTWKSIRALLSAAHIPEPVRETARTVFAALAAAEGRVHGIASDDVHFHEVGALDSIADVVGVCAALHDLDVVRVTAGDVAVGSGRIGAAHGDLPVPVPAVLELARGWRVRAGGAGELATPTGMALLTVLAAECTDLPAMSIDRIGTGAGQRDTGGTANVVRVVLGTARPPAGSELEESLLVLDANIDDLDPRLWPDALAQLLRAGAADAWLTPIVMKKGRPAHTLSALCRPELAAAVRDTMFAHTTTIGVRQSSRHRFALARVSGTVTVAGRPVSVKIAHRQEVIVRATPEYEDVAAAAAATGLPVGDLLQQTIAAVTAAGWIPGRPVPAEFRGRSG